MRAFTVRLWATVESRPTSQFCLAAGSGARRNRPHRKHGAIARTCMHSFNNSTVNSMVARLVARILCGAGYAVVSPPAGAGSFLIAPHKKCEGRWRAEWRNHCSLCAAFPRENAGASRRAVKLGQKAPVFIGLLRGPDAD